MGSISNQTIQLVGAFILGLVCVLFIGVLAVMEQTIPDILDRALYLIFGSFLGVGAANGVRVVVNGRREQPPSP